MKKEELMILGEKVGINKKALEAHYKEDKSAAIAQVSKAAEFLGIKL